MAIFVPVLVALALVLQTPPTAVFESAYSAQDIDLIPDPARAEWAQAPRVVVDRDYFGQPAGGPPMEVRSRWTSQHLYLLFICGYETLNLKPEPNPSVETPRLWTWDVAEAFIGSELGPITRYKELQVSPQGEWVDLDIDRENPRGQAGMGWNSGYSVKSRIDASVKVWYGLMRIPFSAIDTQVPQPGRTFRLGLFHLAGLDPTKQHYAWQPTGEANFHVPKAFGTLRLR